MTETDQNDKEKLLEIVQAARKAALKQILEKIRNQQSLTAQEARTLKEFEFELSDEPETEKEGGQAAAGPTEFRNALEITEYLQAAGWKVAKSTLYKHLKEAKLRPDIDKKRFSLKAVMMYARSFLVTEATKQKLDDDLLARKKVKKELEKLEEEIKARRYKRQIEEGKYVPRDIFELELAGRAAVLETSLKGMIQARAGEFVILVGGDENKARDLLREFISELDLTLNEFASTKEFQVLFTSDDSA